MPKKHVYTCTPNVSTLALSNMSQVSRGVCSGSFTLNPTYGFTYEYIIKITFKVPHQTFDYMFI